MEYLSECLRCGAEFPLREGKKYCSNKCRSADHMKAKRIREKIYKPIEGILRKNHSILISCLNENDLIGYYELINLGFKPQFHTARIKKNGNNIALYYDVGIIYNKDKTIKIISPDEL